MLGPNLFYEYLTLEDVLDTLEYDRLHDLSIINPRCHKHVYVNNSFQCKVVHCNSMPA